MIEIFTDAKLNNKIDGNLLDENVLYYVRLGVHDPSVVEKEINKGQCSHFIDWHPNNTVGQICFRDVAGYVNLFGNKYEVRSTKLLNDLSGTNQVEYLLKEIAEFSSNLVFSPAAPASFDYHTDSHKLTNNTYYIYKYLSGNLFNEGKDSIQRLLDLILNNPHYNQFSEYSYVPTFEVKKYNHSTFQRMASNASDSLIIPKDHDLCRKPFVEKLPNTNTGDKIFPKHLYSTKNKISFDTPENRFIKYFLLWCQEIFMSIYNQYSQYQIREDCQRSLNIIRKYLFNSFFQSISTFSYLPTTSSVLLNRLGYKEIFIHFLNCRSQPKVFNDYLDTIVNSMEIKNISLLYEYWVFFKIVKELFGRDAILEITGNFNEGNINKYGLKVSRGDTKLYYNKTYYHTAEESYNFKLRPDISLEIVRDGETRRFFFDAKYSNTAIPSIEDSPIIVYKNVNVVKMLSYLEAINNSDFAVIVYPGTVFSFYNRRFIDGNNRINKANLMNSFEGVGAIPLSPNHANSNAQLSDFIEKLKEYISID